MDPSSLEIFAARAYMEAQGIRRFVETEVGSVPPVIHDALDRLDAFAEGLIADARAARSATERRAQLFAVPGFRDQESVA
jgi:hypothetical protein